MNPRHSRAGPVEVVVHDGACRIDGEAASVTALLHRIARPLPDPRGFRFGAGSASDLAVVTSLGRIAQAFAPAPGLQAHPLTRSRPAPSVLAVRSEGLVRLIVDGCKRSQPSTPESLRSFACAVQSLGIDVLVSNVDAAPEPAGNEAAFIRALTSVDSGAYRLAERYEQLQLPVVDSPAAIRRGSNKIYQALAFGRAGIDTPRTRIVFDLSDLEEAGRDIGSWPLVVKTPCGSFCDGAFLAENPARLEAIAAPLLAAHGGVLLQRFEPTAFDWRIGVLDGTPLFAARYGMAPGSWKLCERDGQNETWGPAAASPLTDVPGEVLVAACAAARATGAGLWGVDLKVVGDRVLVIEINDNPNINDDVEAACEADAVWSRLADWFAVRLADAAARSSHRYATG